MNEVTKQKKQMLKIAEGEEMVILRVIVVKKVYICFSYRNWGL